MSGQKPTKYILNSAGEPIAAPDLLAWAEAFEKSDRIVKQEDVGYFRVSTVFLGLDYSFGHGPPILWETMVFLKDSGNEADCERCSGSREQALAMHEEMVRHVRAIPVIKEQ